MEVSLRYPPVRGRLHTRYAPVRRSPAVYCYTPLPLDLHVLSLPLAFILSQDQTLHCKNCLYLPFELSFNAFLRLGNASKLPLLSLLRNGLDSSPCPPPCQNRMVDTRYLYLLIRFKFLSPPPRRLSLHAVFSSKADAKIQPFSKPPKYFFKKISPAYTKQMKMNALQNEKKFHRHAKPSPKNNPGERKNTVFEDKKRASGPKTGKNSRKTLDKKKIAPTQEAPLHAIVILRPAPAHHPPHVRLFFACSLVVL